MLIGTPVHGSHLLQQWNEVLIAAGEAMPLERLHQTEP
jgi:hypothetical protein